MADQIDIEVPKTPIDLPVPERGANEVENPEQRVSAGSQEDKLKPKELNENIDALRDIDPENYARMALNVFAANGNAVADVENRAAVFLELGKEDPKNMAMGLDLKMEALQMKLADVKERREEAEGVKKEGLTAEKEQLEAELTKVNSERKLFSQEHIGLDANQIAEFGQMFGISIELIENRMTMLAAQRLMAAAIENEGMAEALIGRLREYGAPEELVSKFDGYVKHDIHKKNETKYGKSRKIAMIGGGLGLLMGLTAWFAMKMETGGRRQQ